MYYIGIDVGGMSIKAGVTDKDGNVLPVAYQMTELNSQDGEVLLESLEVSCGTISRETVSGYENIQREQTAEGGSGGNGGAG